MSTYAQRFWSERDDYHELAEDYERNIEITHPNVVTGRTGCAWCYHCTWEATAVKYYEYRGDSLTPEHSRSGVNSSDDESDTLKYL